MDTIISIDMEKKSVIPSDTNVDEYIISSNNNNNNNNCEKQPSKKMAKQNSYSSIKWLTGC